MDILSLLIKEERVAGIEITSTYIRLAYFRPRKERNKKTSGVPRLPKNELILIEEPILQDTISNGSIIDKDSLSETLRRVWTKARLHTHYAVVTIPPDKVYSCLVTLPKTVAPAKLATAVDLAIDFQFPVKKSDYYIASENIGDFKNTHEVLVSAIPKDVADVYITTLRDAGIKILALETHLGSLARSINLEPGIPTLITKESQDGNIVCILKDGALYFSRTLPYSFIKKGEALTTEVEHLKTAFESDKKMPIAELPFTKASVRADYLNYPELKELDQKTQSKWLVVLGAAIRGEIPKGQDAHISLLPVGMAEAYSYQKMVTFVTLIRNTGIGVSVFFLIAFYTTYLFILSLSETANQINLNLAISPLSKETQEREVQIKKVNEMTAAASAILSTTPNWSMLLDDIYARTQDGVIISSLTVTSVVDSISMVGVAKDRNKLNQLRKSLQDSEYLTAVELPITNLEKKEDIPFSVSFRLTDPGMLYYK